MEALPWGKLSGTAHLREAECHLSGRCNPLNTAEVWRGPDTAFAELQRFYTLTSLLCMQQKRQEPDIPQAQALHNLVLNKSQSETKALHVPPAAHSTPMWSVTTPMRELLSLRTQSSSVSYKSPLTRHYSAPLFQAGLLSYLPWVSSLCMLLAGYIKALGLLHASRREKQRSNYNGMGGRGIVRGRTDAERQEKTISLIQLINIINVIIFLLWFKDSIQESCLLVGVSDKSLQIQKARCCMAVTIPQTSIILC